MRLQFPLAATEEQSADQSKKDAFSDFTGMHLLLAEDNPVNQEIAKMLLAEEGFLVDCVDDGQAAVDAIRLAEPGTYDAVLMDIQMPVMDGYAAARAIRAMEDPMRAGIPIIAMTANAFLEDQKAAYDAGMQGHIPKPLEVDYMLDTLRQVLL